jgi:hypothetical protein
MGPEASTIAAYGGWSVLVSTVCAIQFQLRIAGAGINASHICCFCLCALFRIAHKRAIEPRADNVQIGIRGVLRSSYLVSTNDTRADFV